MNELLQWKKKKKTEIQEPHHSLRLMFLFVFLSLSVF